MTFQPPLLDVPRETCFLLLPPRRPPQATALVLNADSVRGWSAGTRSPPWPGRAGWHRRTSGLGAPDPALRTASAARAPGPFPTRRDAPSLGLTLTCRTCGPGWVVTLCPAMVFTRDLILALFRNHTMLCITVHFIFALFLLRTVSNSGYGALGPQNVTQPLHVAGPLRRAQCMDSVPRRPRAGQQSSSHSRTAPPCRPLAAQPAGRPQMPRFKSPGEWSLATSDASQEGNGFWRKLSEAERDV